MSMAVAINQCKKLTQTSVNFKRSTADDTDRRRPYNLFPNSLGIKCVLDNAHKFGDSS